MCGDDVGVINRLLGNPCMVVWRGGFRKRVSGVDQRETGFIRWGGWIIMAELMDRLNDIVRDHVGPWYCLFQYMPWRKLQKGVVVLKKKEHTCLLG